MNKQELLAKLQGLDMHDGNVSDDDCLALMDLAQRAAKPRCNFLEIGPWKGKSTICLAAVAVKQNGKVWCIDHFKGSPGTKGELTAQAMDVQSIFKKNMEFVNAWQSAVFLISAPIQEVMPLLPPNFFDLIFIDADNRYEVMKTTIQQSFKKLKNRGIICGRNLLHTYQEKRKEVEREINKEYSPEFLLHPGIIKAVHECFKGNYERMPNSSLWYKHRGKDE